MLRKLLSPFILLLATLLGGIAFLYPFFTRPEQNMSASFSAHAADSLFFFVLLSLLCLVILVANLETRQMNAKIIAALGILAAIGSVLRLVPGPGGFSALFFLIILCGYVYGSDFGFVLGVATLVVSGIITSGLGPWLPFQMFSVGWMGLTSGWLPNLSRFGAKAEVLLLGLWGAMLGLLFGAIMNLWFWPYLASPGQDTMMWQVGGGLVDTLRRYGLFYVTTSLWWDMARAGGNFTLILLLGAPVLRLLRRFQKRFQFEIG